VVEIAVGNGFQLALRADGTVAAWGEVNWCGQLGNGTVDGPKSPWDVAQVRGLTNVIAIAAGARHALAVRHDGTVWAWGNNEWNALGDGSEKSQTAPVQVITYKETPGANPPYQAEPLRLFGGFVP
jgi:hypothetical protein